MQLLQRVGEVGKVLDMLQLLNEREDVFNMMEEKFDWSQFRGRLQLDTAAVMGHSFGGTTTVKALYTDKRFKFVKQLNMVFTLQLHTSIFAFID